MSLHRELIVATEAVRKASLLTKRIQSRVIANEDSTITKTDNSPVTIGDFSAQAIIINAIKANFPEDFIVGEESTEGIEDSFVSHILQEIRDNDTDFETAFGDRTEIVFRSADYPLNSVATVKKAIDCGDYEGGSKGRFWCLDPIDGTKGFLRGDQFAVCLALVVDGVVQLGCIGCPNLQLKKYGGQDEPDASKCGYIFRAIKEGGAFYSPTACESWKPVHVRKLGSTSRAVSLEGVEASHSSHDEQSVIKSKLGVSRSQHLDSQVKYCLLAMGLGDLYLRLPLKLSYREKIWDHAAGNIIVKEAGGVHTDAIDNVPLDFGRGRTLSTKGVIASCGPRDLHDLVLKVSSEVIRSRN
ncbi:LAMI_0H19438g1_1 [Lachancea mirantina]|uniref:3'(2'),5'-bisphosphate nucleotidase n=1 Tax=Lachancea mirantina TaxID=1230905 RepID=A0A1G4KJU5_9SACH|nr:LAMI_0H19438g1_1 [Lachancea mirantina]